jgi:dipeptidase D
MELNPVFLGEQPENVWRLFSKICSIPHRSHLHEPMCRFISDYARSIGLEAQIDEAHNVIVRKKASAGREDAPPILLQAHYDMVCIAELGYEFNFDEQPLELKRNGDKVYAKRTTLGGDDGINVAVILDILSDPDAIHPSLEAVFTADEEDGMDGAFGLDFKQFQSKLWINLDASPVKIGSFGSLGMSLHMKKEHELLSCGTAVYTLAVDGLLGGHSGNLATSERGNAIILLGRVLCKLKEKVPFQLTSIDGGLYGGSFPQRARANIAMLPAFLSESEGIVELMQRDFQAEFVVRDPGVAVSISRCDQMTDTALSEDALCRLLCLLTLIPDGVFTRDHQYTDTAETTSNLGRIETLADGIHMIESIRSLIGAKKYFLRDKVISLCSLLDVGWEITGEIPEWRGSINDAMRALLKDIYPERPPVVCKGTMECGIISERMRKAQILVLGSPFYLPHSTAEYILVSETALYTKRLREFIAKADWEHLG